MGEEFRGDFGVELFSADFSDAYPHLRVHPEEYPHCLSPNPLGSDSVILWVMMAFGAKGAPLVWSRFAAAFGRLLQALLRPGEGRLQLYLDDPIWALRGSRRHRDYLISLSLAFLIALGVRISWSKSQRGAQVEWCGVLYLITSPSVLALTLPEKFVKDVLEELAH